MVLTISFFMTVYFPAVKQKALRSSVGIKYEKRQEVLSGPGTIFFYIISLPPF